MLSIKVFDGIKVLPSLMMATLKEADDCPDFFLDNIRTGKTGPKS